MLPEIARAFDPTSIYTKAHGVMCIVASTMFFAASACAFVAGRKWVASDFRSAIAFNLSVPMLIIFGAFFAYLQCSEFLLMRVTIA